MRVLILLILVLFAGCSSSGSREPAPVTAAPTVPPVDEVVLRQGAGDLSALDIAIQVFDRGLDAESESSVYPQLRKAESLMLPVKLSNTLIDSGYWGSVRVVEATDVSVPMRVRGKILRADGSALELAITAVSADGRTLLEKHYRDEAVDADYPVAPGEDPFADIYRAISNDLSRVADGLSSADRLRLERLALIDFASRLAPQTFDSYRERGADGTVSLRSFPADEDPMLGRLQRLRQQDYLFIDTVDEQYRDLEGRIGASYDLWRQYSRELALYGSDYRARAGERDRAGRRGSFASLQQVYGTFRKVKLQEEDLEDLVAGFAGESLETVMDVDDGVVRLRGSVTDRYAEWRQILTRIYALESGGVAP